MNCAVHWTQNDFFCFFPQARTVELLTIYVNDIFGPAENCLPKSYSRYTQGAPLTHAKEYGPIPKLSKSMRLAASHGGSGGSTGVSGVGGSGEGSTEVMMRSDLIHGSDDYG